MGLRGDNSPLGSGAYQRIENVSVALLLYREGVWGIRVLLLYLGGEDPVAWLERVLDRLVHLHAKDISVEQSDAERGKVTGTPVGCACGDGVIDWEKIVAACRRAPRDIVLSVECGTVEQAARSIEHLRPLVARSATA